MTNFIYNMQDELFYLNMILPVGKFSPIKKLVDHIEAQGKQLRELNAAITKRNKTIENYEREKELKEGIRDSEDLTWKQKYDALLHSSEQAIGALQKKWQEYKNAEYDATANTIETLVKENKELKEKVKHLDARIKDLVIRCDEEYDKNKELEDKVKGLEAANEKLLPIATISLSPDNQRKEITRLLKNQKKLEAQITNDAGIISQLSTNNVMLLKKIGELEKEKQVSKDLNAIINSKNKLLDEYMTNYNNLEHNYKEELRMKENLKATCFRHEETIKYLKGKVADYISLNNVLKGKLVSIGEFTNKIDDVILSEEGLYYDSRTERANEV